MAPMMETVKEMMAISKYGDDEGDGDGHNDGDG